MKAELEAQEKARSAAKVAAAAALAENKPIPKSPKKKMGLPGKSTAFPITAVPWP